MGCEWQSYDFSVVWLYQAPNQVPHHQATLEPRPVLYLLEIPSTPPTPQWLQNPDSLCSLPAIPAHPTPPSPPSPAVISMSSPSTRVPFQRFLLEALSRRHSWESALQPAWDSHTGATQASCCHRRPKADIWSFSADSSREFAAPSPTAIML